MLNKVLQNCLPYPYTIFVHAALKQIILTCCLRKSFSDKYLFIKYLKNMVLVCCYRTYENISISSTYQLREKTKYMCNNITKYI